MDNDTLSKLQKMFKMAERSTHPEEAASFLGKANAIMLERNITQQAVDGYDDDPVAIFDHSPLNEEDSDKRILAQWKRGLAYYITTENGCYYFNRGGNMILVGKADNVANCRYMYEYCMQAVERIVKAQCKGQGRTYTNNFRHGCVDSIHNSIVGERNALKARLAGECAERALVLLSNIPAQSKAAEGHAKQKLNLVSRSGGAANYDKKARLDGRAAGKEIYDGKQKYIN